MIVPSSDFLRIRYRLLSQKMKLYGVEDTALNGRTSRKRGNLDLTISDP